MVRKTKGKSDAERQEPESQESSLRGKAIASERAGSGTQRTSRQKTVAAKKAKEQEKRAGKSIAMVSFFVNHLEHYRDWPWYTTDSQPKVGIGGMITPLLQFLNVPLGKDAAGPKFIDGTYLRISTYFNGMYGKDYVYHYYLQGKPVKVVLLNQRLTSLERPGAISFNLSQEDFLGEHGSLGPIAAPRKRSIPTRHDFTELPREESVPIYGPPRYYFKPHDGAFPWCAS
ncbi:hypothetical protein Bca4012_092055 [Brassica carinata]